MSILKKSVFLIVSVCLVLFNPFPFNEYGFVILVFVVSLIIIPSNKYNVWVYVDSNKTFDMYYNPSSVKIDKQQKIIKVLVKHDLTESGKIDLVEPINRIDKHKGNYTNHTLLLYLIKYKEWKYSINHIRDYLHSGKVIRDNEYPPKWKEITCNSIFEILLNKLLQDFNIKT